MGKSWLIAVREWRERVTSRSFLIWSLIGPLVVLGFTYLLFSIGGSTKAKWNVLVVDPVNIMQGKMNPHPDKNLTFFFADGYIEHQDFANSEQYQKYDAMIEIHEKVLSNKQSFVFYRENPSMRIRTKMRYYVERRLEEVLLDQYTDLSSSEFRRNIKQKLDMEFRDVYDPENASADMSGWVGYFFGCVIFLFIFLFGMTVLRSTAREKSNRIVEVLLSSAKTYQLMLGKIIGIGLAAMLQFVIWAAVIGVGLYFMRELLFSDLFDPMGGQNIAAATDAYSQEYFAGREYNEFVGLVYQRIQFANVLFFFFLFFIGGYLFYAAFLSAIGATMGSESDGQQFVIPVLLILCFSLYGGYYVLNFPHGPLASFFHYLPFTSPVAVMVKLAYGYPPGEAYQIYLSLLILIVSSIFVLWIGSRIYKNGILQFGHRLRLVHIIKWLRRT